MKLDKKKGQTGWSSRNINKWWLCNSKLACICSKVNAWMKYDVENWTLCK